ncbi:MAG: transposase [Caldilineaceae bacterium]
MNVRRYYVPNAVVFITQVVDHRIPIFQHAPFIEQLRINLRNVQALHPFVMMGYIFLPEHFHLMFRPTGKSTFSNIMQSLKRNFTLDYKKLIGVNGPMKFWQKGFWDHVIRDEIDFERHLDYIHYNPVRHQLVDRPEAWPHSSFCHWQQRQAYPERWGWSLSHSITQHNWERAEEDNLT